MTSLDSKNNDFSLLNLFFYTLQSSKYETLHKPTSSLTFVKNSILTRDAMHKRGLCCRPVSLRLNVRLSVCLSVTFVYCIQTAEDIVKLLSRPGNFLTPRAGTQFQEKTPIQRGRKIHRSGERCNFRLKSIAVYSENGTR